MVAETVTEPEVTQSDAPAETQSQSDSPEVTGEALRLQLEAAENVTQDEDKESEGDEEAVVPDPVTREAIEARIRAELEEQTQQTEAQKAQEESAKRARESDETAKKARKEQFDQRAPGLRAWAEDKARKGEPLTQEDADALLNWYSTVNGEADAVYADAAQNRLYDTASKLLPESKRVEFLALRDTHGAKATPEERLEALMSDFASVREEAGRDGYVKKADVNKQVEDALIKQYQYFLGNPAALTSQANGARDHTGGSSTGQRTYRSEAELDAAFNDLDNPNRPTPQHYAAEKKRLTGREL